LKIFLLIVGGLVIVNCYWLIAEGLFPHFVERSRKGYEENPVKNTLKGIAIAGPSVAIGLSILDNFSGQPLLAIFGWIAVLGPALIGLLGSAGLAQRVGCGLPSPNDVGQPWLRVLRGGIVLSICCLLPFLGWFVILPIVLVSGFGNGLVAIRSRHRMSAPMNADVNAAAA
jgi:hypothetical protein